MKTIILALLLLVNSILFGQTPISKSIPYQKGQRVVMHFDYPDMIRVHTWDKNEISIQGEVSINGGESDDAFKLQTSSNAQEISISNIIENMKNLPQRITIVDGGKKIVFKNKAEYRKYADANGRSFDTMSWGVNMEITIDVTVPKGVETWVESVYGMVEIREFDGPLTVDAKYGGVDASLNERMVGDLVAETNYGQIYTNLDAKFGSDGFKQQDFHMVVTAKPGTGPKYSFESQYGNVYLRKSN